MKVKVYFMFDQMVSDFTSSLLNNTISHHECQGPGSCRIDSTRDWGVDKHSPHQCTLFCQLLADCRIYRAAVYQQRAGPVGAEDTI